MKENNFIEQNKNKWLEFEELRRKKFKNPSRLSKLFIQLTDDLSYARTFYKTRQVRYYLNSLSQYLFVAIYKNNKIKAKDIWGFWKTTLPLTLYKVRKEMLFTFLLFLLSFFIGMISAANDHDFARLILSEEYIQQTLENIKNHNPMGVYKKSSELNMMFGISINNLMVSVMTFVSGLFASIGSIFMMMYNGIMVGTFQYFFIERGLFWVSFLTIWQHGTLEISSIIIAGTAGIVLGKGLLFPGSYKRREAFRISGKRGFIILAGIAPTIILAAFIESFFTRYTELPDIIRVAVIVCSLVFVLFYFVFYPARVNRKNTEDQIEYEELEYKDTVESDLKEIYSGGELFENSFHLFYRKIFSVMKIVIVLSLSFTFIYAMQHLRVWSDNSATIISDFSVTQLFFFDSDFLLISFVRNIFLESIIFILCFRFSYSLPYQNQRNIPPLKEYLRRAILPVFISILLINGIFYLTQGMAWLLMIIFLPVFMQISYISQHKRIAYLKVIKLYYKQIRKEYFKLFALMFKFLFLGFAVLLFLQSNAFSQVMKFVEWNIFAHSSHHLTIAMSLIYVFINAIVVFLLLAQIAIAISLFYYTLSEKYSAEGLKQRISEIGSKRKIIGYERE